MGAVEGPVQRKATKPARRELFTLELCAGGGGAGLEQAGFSHAALAAFVWSIASVSELKATNENKTKETQTTPRSNPRSSKD
jgi:hypothetical protein